MEREHLGPFRILSLLGAGGMGRVYKARVEHETAKLEIGEVVALKVIHPHLFSRQGVFHRFLREAEAGRRIRHPNVIRTLYVDAILEALEHYNFLVMEYLEGRNLRQLLDELGTVPDALLREIARQVCAGLAAIHDAGIVHRDLKPENVLIAEDQQVKIMDLGLARLVEESVALTKAGQFFGTFTYAAPEIYEEGEAVLSSDVYSVGVMLYELATGGNPFHHEDAASVMRAHLKLVPPPAHEQNPEISPFLSAVIATMLEKRVRDRLESAEAVQAVLEEGERGAWWEKKQLEISRASDRLPVIPIRRDASIRGREPELRVIREAWAEARDGRGSTVLLEGEAGIGKTRLIDGFLAELSGEDVHVLYGAYPPPSGVGALTEAIADKLGAADLEKTLARYLKVTPALVPAFAALVRHDSPPEGIEPLKGDSLHTVMCHLLRALSEEKPLVWVVDDLQFAESDNRMIVLSMARAARDHRALLVVAARPGLPEDEIAHFSRLDGFRRVEVARLASPHVAEILTDVLRSEVLSSRLGPTIAEKSDGIPFFVFEMIRELKEGSFITERPDGTFVESRSIEEIEVPSAVRDMIQARLKDLSRDERDVLEVGAVQGIVFDPSLVASVLGKRPLAVLQDLADLERRSGVVRGEAGRCRFDHHQIQLVLYQDLLPDLRAEYHSLLAEAVAERSAAGTLPGPETLGDREILLAHHHVHGSRPQMCLPHLGPALDHLEKAFRNEAARELADLALNVPGLLEGPVRTEILLRKADMLNRLARRGEERETLDEALKLADEAGEPAARARVRVGLGWHNACKSRHEAASEWLTEALDLAREGGDRGAEEIAARRLGLALTHLGRSESALEQYLGALALAKEAEDRHGEASTTGHLGVFFQSFGRYEEARAYLERALAISREIGDRVEAATATWNLGRILEVLGRYEETREHYERALAVSREIGDRRKENLALAGLGRLASALGDPAEARRLLFECRRLAEEIGDRVLFGSALFEEGVAEERQGNLAEAETRYGEAFAQESFIPLPPAAALSLAALGRVLLDQGRVDDARSPLEEALELGRELSVHGAVVCNAAHLARIEPTRAPAAEAALTTNEPRLDHASKIEARFALWQATGERRHLEEAHRLLGYLRDHAPSDCREPMISGVRLHRAISEAMA